MGILGALPSTPDASEESIQIPHFNINSHTLPGSFAIGPEGLGLVDTSLPLSSSPSSILLDRPQEAVDIMNTTSV